MASTFWNQSFALRLLTSQSNSNNKFDIVGTLGKGGHRYGIPSNFVITQTMANENIYAIPVSTKSIFIYFLPNSEKTFKALYL